MMNRNRKNGKLASCEPCRLHKIRCDHARPVCGRCEKRGKACFYHPAPLTRPRSGGPRPGASTSASGISATAATSLASSQSQNESSPGEPDSGVHISTPPTSVTSSTSPSCGPPSVKPGNAELIRTQSAPEHVIKADLGHRPLLEARATFFPGHLGPASYAAAFAGDSTLSKRTSVDIPPPCEVMSRSHQDASRMHAALSVINKLSYFPTIDRLVRAYYDISQAATIASTLIYKSLEAIEPVYHELMARGARGPSEQFISKLLENTAKPINLASVSNAADVHKLFTGEHLGLEILGILFALAGRTRVFGQGPEYDLSFADEMLEACDTILRLYDDSYPTNYLVVWLLYETTLLTMSRLGDANPKVWCRLGNLASAVYALGIHRESQEDSGDPFFVLEARRKAFAAAYQLDKSISTFLGRPPRICYRHCTTSLPLDLCDDEIELTGEALDNIRSKLDANGWSPPGDYHRASWIRCRYLISITREEVLDFSLMPSTQQTLDHLQQIAIRCDDMWQRIPDHLRYSHSCWTKGIDSNVCIMLVIVWLSQLHTKFLIQRLFSKLQPHRDDTDLINVSLELLTCTLSVGKQRDRLANFHRDFAWVMMLYGLPSAGVLAARLERLTRANQPLPASLSRAELIRNLSVFVSYLDGISSPGDGNYALCTEACKVLSALLDETLNGPPRTQPNLYAASPSALTPSAMGVANPMALGMSPVPSAFGGNAIDDNLSSSIIQGPSALGDPDFSWSTADVFGDLDWNNVVSAQFVI